jgi:Spy/CpxP family protein refolding chaperone
MRLLDKTTRRLLVLGVVGTLVLGALALPALAQNATETPSEITPSPGPFKEDRQSAFVEALAEELNLPVDQVTDAVTAAHEKLAEQWRDERVAALQQRLDEAVAAGKLTQEQADAIVAATEAGVFSAGPGPEVHGPRFDHGPGFGHKETFDGPPMLHDAPYDDSGA